MAALQKIRSKGAILILVVGLALFAFIAEEAVRSLSSSRTESRQRVGEVNGKSINIQDFNKLVEEYTDVVKFTSGMENLTEEQTQSIRDQVWNQYVQEQLIQHQADELGLAVTDAEVQDIIKKGASPMLRQTPFSNPQTGTFDVEALNNFLTSYKAMKDQPGQPADAVAYYDQIYNYWKFIEKNIRSQQLSSKLQNLITKSFISNPTSIEAAFNARSNEKEVLLAALPYSSIKDADVTVEDKDLQAKYNELKEAFRMDDPTRDIKYIDVNITASKADRDQINKEMEEVAAQLQAEGADVANIVRKSGSTVSYSPVPIRRQAMPSDIAKQVDSMSVGQQKGPFLNAQDNTQNIVRLLAKSNLPDSIQVRQIGVSGENEAAAQKVADSVMIALGSGIPFDSIARKYNQTGEETWITSAQYEGQTMDDNNRKFVNAILTQAEGTTQQVKLGNTIIITRVLARKNFVEKYDVAIVKRPLDFSNDTYNKTYNDFSQFVASNKTIEEIEENALKAGYMVQQRPNFFPTEHNIAGISGTREAIRWIFNKDTKVGEISEIYTCGNNDHLLIVAVTGKNDSKFRTLESVKDYIQNEALRDKKATQLLEAMASVKDITAASKLKGAEPIDTIKHVTFNAPVFLSSLGASEPALSGAITKAQKGQFVEGVKGNAGVYAFQVIGENNTGAKLDDAAKQTTQQQIVSQQMRASSRFMQELAQKAKVQDNRYLFY
ncbi:MAG: SurA N-terminal domain-containing protein [Bacteroidaceae bacterium]|nr:SurA N-terminal domain-containing protein [Bacteroidaceae bacterium]